MNLTYLSNDKINTDAIAANLRKNILVGISKCIRTLKLTLFGRGTAARALPACHIDKTALYKINHDQTKNTQTSYDKYVVGNTKLGKKTDQNMCLLKKEVPPALTF